MTSTPPRLHAHDRIGDGIVVVLGLGMLVAPLVATLVDVELDAIAMSVRAMVVGLALVTTWMPLPVGRAWRRMMAVSMMAAHHVGVGVAAGMPDALLVELLGGAVLTGALASWLLPRAGFGMLISTTLAVGTIALGLMPPPGDLGRLSVWAGVFLLGGIAAEISVWLAAGREPSAPEPTVVVQQTPAPPIPVGRLFAAAALGSARLSGSDDLLVEPSDQLSRMVSPWGSAAVWWGRVLTRGRNPTQPGLSTQIEMIPPDGDRRSFRLQLVDVPDSGRHLLVEDITAWVSARREASDLKTRLEQVEREAQTARDARERALHARSHNLRTPLHNLKTNLELLEGALDDGASPAELRAELRRANSAVHQMVLEVNSLLDGIVKGDEASRDALLDVVVVVDTALDELASIREVHRSYGQKSIPIRGPRAELTTLVRDLVKAAVGAANDPIEVQVYPTLRGQVQLSFEAEPTDEALVRMVLGALASRVAGVGGESDLDGAGPPSVYLPEDRSKARGVEAEVTWPGAIPVVEHPSTPRGMLDEPSLVSAERVPHFGLPIIDQAESTDDEPTHLLRVRASARQRRSADSGDEGERLG